MIVALALVGFLELGSALVLYATTGKLFTPAAARAEREAVERRAQRRSNRAARLTMEPSEAQAADQEKLEKPPEVVHPFLGFVRDPTYENVHFPANELGFFASEPPPGPVADRFTVGVFGGSVAVGLARSWRLVKEIKRSPALRGREIWVRNFALGGYKQPQQLISLNYLLALGERLDVVVNLDGFNDVTLALRPYQLAGLYPFYPRRWPLRVAQLPDVESQRLVGEIVYLEGRRARRAGWCSQAPLSWSPTCHLGWRALDSRSAGRLAVLRKAFSQPKEERRAYLTHGPRAQYATDDELARELAELWGRSSLQMHQLCAAKGIRYLHFLQPNQYVPGSKTLTLEERRKAFRPELPWAESVARGYPHLLRVGRELEARGVRFHDLTMMFAEVEGTVYKDSCCHFNKQGVNLIAKAIARAVTDDP